VVVDDAYSIDDNSTLAPNVPGVLSNDVYNQGDLLDVLVVTGVSNGTLTLNTDGSFVYSPNPNYSGTDSFTYMINDGINNSNTATVSITIQPCLLNCYFVDAINGTDANLGTSRDHAWRTIQKAANTMVAGDSVTVLAGTYDERVQVNRSGASGNPISYQAEGQVVMKGFAITASYIDINGFEVANSAYQEPGIMITGAYNIIENNYVHHSAMIGIWILTSTASGTNLTTHDNIVRNNKIYYNQTAGMDITGRNNLVEGNEIWGSQQCLPIAGSCSGDADGIRFFGQGHVFRKNYIHDLSFGPLGINPSIGDYVDNAHIDCFQTWSNNEWSEQASNIIFEQNYCDNLQFQNDYEKGQGWMMEGNAYNITIRNNIVRAYRGINTRGGSGTQANHLYIYNNIFINNLSFPAQPNVAELYNPTYSIIKNNIFYDQKNTTLDLSGNLTGIDIDYNLSYNSDGTQPPYEYSATHELRGVNPQFVNPNSGDFHLLPDSPAIDIGLAIDTVINDFDGLPRHQGSGYDIGVFEYQPGG
jgi:hypothetical protein